MARASYRYGVEWIALNDEEAELDLDAIAGYISTSLLADLFGKAPIEVARAIRRYRLRRHEAPRPRRLVIVSTPFSVTRSERQAGRIS
jgi:hypothetical protein